MADVGGNDVREPPGCRDVGGDGRQTVPPARRQHDCRPVPGVLPRHFRAETAGPADDHDAEPRSNRNRGVVLQIDQELVARVGGDLGESLRGQRGQADNRQAKGRRCPQEAAA